jgi:hypothetical protein
MKSLLLMAGFGVSRICFSQVACIGSEAHCEKVQRKICAAELRKPAPANLFVPVDEQVTGRLMDQADAPLGGPDIALLIKDVPGQTVLGTATPGQDGRFSLGPLKSGYYRLLAARRNNGSIERLAPFSPPAAIECQGTNPCEVDIRLIGGATDQVTDTCPPR